MSVLERMRAAVGRVAKLTRRGTRRGQLEVQVRRTRGRIMAEEALIGRLLYPQIEERQLEVGSPDVHEAVRRLSDLLAELEDIRTQVEAVGSESGADDAASVTAYFMPSRE